MAFYDKLTIRWMIRRDMKTVVKTERYYDGLTKSEMIEMLRQRNYIGMICEGESMCVLGHMIYALEKRSLVLHTLKVPPAHRCNGVGTALICKILGKLSPERRSRLVVPVDDEFLVGLCWLRRRGFFADPNHQLAENGKIVMVYEADKGLRVLHSIMQGDARVIV